MMEAVHVEIILFTLALVGGFFLGRAFERWRLRVPADTEVGTVITHVRKTLEAHAAPGHLAPRALREGVRNELARRGYRWAPIDLKRRLGQL